MKVAVFKLLVFSLIFLVSPLTTMASGENPVTRTTDDLSDNYTGKRKRNSASPASKKHLSRQSKRARASIRRNEKRNKKQLRYRTKKQRKQKRFSARDCFR
ncbi:MAG: hypothetical protein ACO1O6_03180 [Bacteroidota bacterium]